MKVPPHESAVASARRAADAAEWAARVLREAPPLQPTAEQVVREALMRLAIKK